MWLRCSETSTSRHSSSNRTIADGNSEVASGHVFEFVGFVEDHGAGFGQNSGIGRILRLLLDRRDRRRTGDG